jgi:hypothetical protein
MDPIHESIRMEVDEITKWDPRQPQIADELGPGDLWDTIAGLEFQDDPTINYKIKPIPRIELH